MKKSLTISLAVLLFVSMAATSFIIADNSYGSSNLASTASISSSGSTLNSTAANVTNNNDSTTSSITAFNRTTDRVQFSNSENGSEIKHPILFSASNHENETRPLPYPSAVGRNVDDQKVEVGRAQSLSGEVTCRINFNMGVINSLITAFPNSSADLQQIVTSLQNDLAQIQSSTNSSDVQDFVKNHYENDMKSIVGTVNSFRNHEGDKMPLAVRAQLVTSYKGLLANYTQCEQQSYLNISMERVNAYQTQINNFQSQANKLADKGFNTSALNQLLQDAQAQIVVPLQNALTSSSNASDVQVAVKSYCLFDGCVNGTNFHLDAKFNIARLNIILFDLQTNADAFSLNNATLSQAQQHLADAQTTLDSAGTSAYQKGQAQTIFSDVQQASKLIVQLMAQVLKQPIGGLK